MRIASIWLSTDDLYRISLIIMTIFSLITLILFILQQPLNPISKGEFTNLLFLVRTPILVMTQRYPRLQTEMWNMVSSHKRRGNILFLDGRD